VLGAGRQGVSAGYDMVKFGDPDELLLFDINGDNANAGAERINSLLGTNAAKGYQADLSKTQELKPMLQGCDAWVCAAHFPLNLGLTVLAIELGANMTDMGGHTGVVRQQIELTGKAQEAGITVVPDCGMGPGLNVSLGVYSMTLVGKPRDVLIWDGGLPQDPVPPWNYAGSFNIDGLTNEYYGSAYFLSCGEIVEVPCFEGYELLNFPTPLDTLEAFVTSGGLSTSPWSLQGKLQRLENKTLRYPGHVAQFKAFRDLGLFEQDVVKVGNKDVVPRDLYHILLGPKITLPEFKDICVMRVKCIGEDGNKGLVELIDTYDEETGFTAMQRLTGWHASIVALLAADDKLEKGVNPVESVSGELIVEEIRKRGIEVNVQRTE